MKKIIAIAIVLCGLFVVNPIAKAQDTPKKEKKEKKAKTDDSGAKATKDAEKEAKKKEKEAAKAVKETEKEAKKKEKDATKVDKMSKADKVVKEDKSAKKDEKADNLRKRPGENGPTRQEIEVEAGLRLHDFPQAQRAYNQ